MTADLPVGSFAVTPGGPGIGKIAAMEGGQVRIDYFESVAHPHAQSNWVSKNACRPVTLEPQDRVWWRSDSGGWNTGRVVRSTPGGSECYVRFPNADFDFPLPVRDLHVRWNRPVSDPVAGLSVRGGSSAPFRDARLPMAQGVLRQRAACAGLTALLSSAVEFYPHQIHAALTILTDPVQRYLLADEVGLGKTIEAGVVIRQTLIDNPTARVAVLAPEVLRRQWVTELREKFFIDDFPHAHVRVVSHDAPARWTAYHNCDLVVVDEAHELVSVSNPDASPYRELRDLAVSSPRLLLLSATPVTSHYLTNLSLLHLLDPDLYRWDRQAEFEDRYRLRSALADAVYSLAPDITYMARDAIDDIGALVPASDSRFAYLAAAILDLLDEDDELRDPSDEADFANRVHALRAHLSETYRLHRRVIRNRRDVVLGDDAESDTESYTVRGRQRPLALRAPASGDERAREVLSRWWKAITDHLLDTGGESRISDYAMVLAVLTSRAAALPHDLVDALQWRLSRESVCAERAGLNAQEQSFLSRAPVLPVERSVLDGTDVSRRPSDMELQDLVPVVRHGARKARRCVVFCGPGQLAPTLVDHLQGRFPALHVHEHTRRVDPDTSTEFLNRWRDPRTPAPAVLIVDDSAEDGLNLQVADAVLHLRLPLSPNQLEQRLGRVDRYRGAESISQPEPAAQFVLSADSSPDASFGEAWTHLAVKGYGIFDQSVSTLQDAIAISLDRVWTAAVQNGPEGLLEQTASVEGLLAEAKDEIAKLDMLESIHRSQTALRSIPAALNELEQDWKTLEGDVLRYTSNSDGGIKLPRQSRTQDGVSRRSFSVHGTDSRPLLAPRQWRSVREQVAEDSVSQGVFNRSMALRAPGVRLLRLGNPFVDALAEALSGDDLGQTAAFRRLDRSMRDAPPEPYFGFDYAVEADINEALDLVKEYPDAGRALRRRADLILAPFTFRVWVKAGTNEPITDAEQYGWLNRPYTKSAGDQNYNSQRAPKFFAIFGGQDACAQYAYDAEKSARSHLVHTEELERRCAEAQKQAGSAAVVLHAQAAARKAAGRLVGDAEALVTDAAVLQALADGLSRPTITVTAAACVVRAGLERVDREP